MYFMYAVCPWNEMFGTGFLLPLTSNFTEADRGAADQHNTFENTRLLILS